MPRVTSNSTGLMKRAEMSVEPAGKACEDGSDDEGGKPDAEGVDAERFHHRIAAAKRPHGTPDA